MTMKQYERVCPICGKKFTTNSQPVKMCSPECVKIRGKQWADAYYSREDIKKKIRIYRREYSHKTGRCEPKCIICGKPIEHTYEYGNWHTRMHDNCVYVDCINTLNSGHKLSSKQLQRLIARGYNIAMFKEEFREYLLDSPISNENEREQGVKAFSHKE